jgi:hypothetical protein
VEAIRSPPKETMIASPFGSRVAYVRADAPPRAALILACGSTILVHVPDSLTVRPNLGRADRQIGSSSWTVINPVERGCAPINHVPFKGGTEPLGKGRRLIVRGAKVVAVRAVWLERGPTGEAAR